MTIRMDFAYVALAAMAVLIADVTAAHAATKICDVMPWRCRYETDGRNYYWSPGHHMPAYGATAAGTATGSQAWGCGATDGTARGRSWGFPNRAAASFRALSECAKRRTHCHIVSCSSSVHNYNEAGAILYSDAHR